MLLTISGPSTVGKDTVWLPAAESLGFSREVPYTTRFPRQDEQPGRDYRFVRVSTFHTMIKRGAFTEWDYTLGSYYGTGVTLRQRIMAGENVVLQVLARMALRIKARLPGVRTVILLSSDPATLAARLTARGYEKSEIDARMQHSAEEQRHADLFDCIVPDADVYDIATAESFLRDICPV